MDKRDIKVLEDRPETVQVFKHGRVLFFSFEEIREMARAIEKYEKDKED